MLFYGLLAGQTPFDAKEMMQGGLEALVRIIRERDPMRLSSKLITPPGDSTAISMEEEAIVLSSLEL